MSWFTIHTTDTAPVVKELRRLNDLLELIIRLQYDFHVTPPKPSASDSNEPDSVSYASDETLAKQEMLDEVKHFEAAVVEMEREGQE
jgi:hypothetical protein